MGEAILAGWLSPSCGAFSKDNIVVVDPGEDRRQHIRQTYGVICIESAALLPASSVVLLAVKPQVMSSVLAEMSSLSWVSDALVISIAAGITTQQIAAAFRQSAIVRVMPNTPLMVGAGAVALCAGPRATEDSLAFVESLFSSIGTVVRVDESQMDAVTAVSGSGPAYVAALIEAMVVAGVQEGLSAEVAEKLAVATIEGTGSLLRITGQTAARTRQDVCSPGGTTLAALSAMEHMGYSASIQAGVHAAAVRSKELSQ